MASSAPTTPISRRSTSLPAGKLPLASNPDQLDTLYTLPSARIIQFTSPTSTASAASRHGSPEGDEEPGTLPWTTRFERTVAIGGYK